MKKLGVLVLVVAFVFCGAGCGAKTNEKNNSETASLWDSALYLEDSELGQGSRTFYLAVEAEEKAVRFTVHTDKDCVGEALLDENLIEGEAGDYGLYVKKVNGITADYDIDQSYWTFYIGSEYAMTGVDSTEIVEGTEYRLVYTK